VSRRRRSGAVGVVRRGETRGEFGRVVRVMEREMAEVSAPGTPVAFEEVTEGVIGVEFEVVFGVGYEVVMRCVRRQGGSPGAIG
jgi:hypothetical protein